jgi:site-specific recombinase XerD
MSIKFNGGFNMTKRGRVYNRIFNEEEWEQVNKENKQIMEDYLEEYRQRKKKPSTLNQYHADLRIVFLYVLRELDNKSILELKKKDFRRFNIWLQDLNMSNARVNRIMSSMRSMLSYIEDDDEYDYDNNIARKVHGLPKEPVRTNEDNLFLSFEQIMKLREELIKRNELQLAVLLMVSFDSGGRRNEIFQIKKQGLLDGNKTNIVTGKRGKTFPLVYLDDTKELIRQYLEQRGQDDINSLWIHINKDGGKTPVTYQTLYDRVIKMSEVLSEIEGKEIQFFPHSLRHSRIEILLQGLDPRILDEKGQPKKFTLEQVQLFAHHSDPKTTQNYSKDHTEDVIDNMFGF